MVGETDRTRSSVSARAWASRGQLEPEHLARIGVEYGRPWRTRHATTAWLRRPVNVASNPALRIALTVETLPPCRFQEASTATLLEIALVAVGRHDRRSGRPGGAAKLVGGDAGRLSTASERLASSVPVSLGSAVRPLRASSAASSCRLNFRKAASSMPVAASMLDQEKSRSRNPSIVRICPSSFPCRPSGDPPGGLVRSVAPRSSSRLPRDPARYAVAHRRTPGGTRRAVWPARTRRAGRSPSYGTHQPRGRSSRAHAHHRHLRPRGQPPRHRVRRRAVAEVDGAAQLARGTQNSERVLPWLGSLTEYQRHDQRNRHSSSRVSCHCTQTARTCRAVGSGPRTDSAPGEAAPRSQSPLRAIDPPRGAQVQCPSGGPVWTSPTRSTTWCSST